MAEKDRLTYDQLKKDTELFNRYYDRANAELATGGYKITSTVKRNLLGTDQLWESNFQQFLNSSSFIKKFIK